LAILGIGTATPATSYDQKVGLCITRTLCALTEEQVSWLSGVYEGTGIHKRHAVFPQALVEDVLRGTRASGSVFLPRPAPGDLGPSTGQRMRVYAEEAPPLALAAARQALDRAGVAAAGVTHLVTVSCTGFHAPGVDAALIRGLGLPATTQRTHVGFMGCHG